jgi:hypothetical protein
VTRRTATSLTTALSDQAWTFERTLTLHERGDHGIVEAAYEVHAHADLSQWAWAQHPMIAASTELRVECAESSPIRVDSAWAEGALTSRVDWLAPDGVLATGTSLERGTGSAAKVWLERRPAWLAVRAGRHRLRWLLEESGAPHIGLWVNLGGWTAGVPLMHVGVEPAFGAHDAPVAAYDGGAGPALRAGDSHAWRVLLELTDSDKR